MGSTTAVARVSSAPRNVTAEQFFGSAHHRSGQRPHSIGQSADRHEHRVTDAVHVVGHVENDLSRKRIGLEDRLPAAHPKRLVRSCHRIAPTGRKFCRSGSNRKSQAATAVLVNTEIGLSKLAAVSTVGDATKGTSRALCPRWSRSLVAETIAPTPITATAPTTEGERSEICIRAFRQRGENVTSSSRRIQRHW